jgi:hypothetical protein
VCCISSYFACEEDVSLLSKDKFSVYVVRMQQRAQLTGQCLHQGLSFGIVHAAHERGHRRGKELDPDIFPC